MGNKKSKNKPNKKNNISNDNNNYKNSKNIYCPKFRLIKNFDTGSSVYYCFELLDGRLFICIGGYSFDIYNISDLVGYKRDLRINPGIYTVSSTQAHTGNIVICTYGKDMKIFSIDNNEVKEIQAITAENDRENFVYELSNGQLITMNWTGRIKLSYCSYFNAFDNDNRYL